MLDKSYPIQELLPEITKILETSSNLVIKAATGAGKSTILPLELLQSPWLKGQKILVLEPRRLTTKTIAHRMASLCNQEVGKTVGYRIRFESKVSSDTIIEVITEGILTRMLQDNPTLEGIGCVVFDEFHERNIHFDLALALCRDVQSCIRPDLRLLIMSATIDIPELVENLDCKVVESKGRQYNVEVSYEGDIDANAVSEFVVRVVRKALKEKKGDILVFLPGEFEIKQCYETLHATKGTTEQIHCLYGQLSFAQQQHAILPDSKGRRKIVLSTNIAETGVTIQGINIVVDSGFERVAVFNPQTGLTKLETVIISIDSAEQRKGRAGRTAPGYCYRLWSFATHSKMQQCRTPEIEQADLCNLMLELANWGNTDYTKYSWITLPPKLQVFSALDTLERLLAIEDNYITPLGKEIHAMPVHPRIAHMLLFAKSRNLEALACDIAAILEERDPLGKESGININLRIDALRRFRSTKNGSNRFKSLEKLSSQYRSFMKVEEDNAVFDWYDTGILLAYAYPERIACARPGNNAQFQLANGKLAMVHHSDELSHEPWLVCAVVSERDVVGKIFMASQIDPKDLRSLVRTKEEISWNRKKGGVIAQKELRIGSIILQSTPIVNVDKQFVIQAISEAIVKEGEILLDFNEDVAQLQNRMQSLAIWNPEQKWPNFSTEYLLQTNKNWLLPYLTDIKTADELKKLNLVEILQYSIDIEVQNQLQTLAPQKIQVPSGSFIMLNYQKDGSAPILAARLQECFGLQTTPLVNNAKQSVLMHLLSPGYKLVQITSDLASFWNNAYFEVRKQLRMKYPKHYWPENPLEAEAVRGVKRK